MYVRAAVEQQMILLHLPTGLCMLMAQLVRRMGERKLTVSFAEPKQSDVAPQGAQDKVLYVGNLPEGALEERIRETFSAYGQVIHLADVRGAVAILACSGKGCAVVVHCRSHGAQI